MIDKRAAYEKADCLAAYGRHLAYSMGGRVTEWKGVQLCDAKLAWRSRNMVVPLRPLDDDVKEQLFNQISDFYGPGGWVLWDVFGDDLSAHNFRLGESHPVMTRFVKPKQQPLPEGLSIREVTDDDGVRSFEELRQIADVYPPKYDPKPGAFFDARILSPEHRLWIGYIDDEPIATAAAFANGDLNLIKNVSTAATHRGHGIGLAMSEHATRSSEKRPILDGVEKAVPMYVRLGFEVVGENAFWVSP